MAATVQLSIPAILPGAADKSLEDAPSRRRTIAGRYGCRVATSADQLDDLAAFVRASPSSFHAAAEAAHRLVAAGFRAQDEAAEWDSSPGGHVVVRGGAVIAWRIPDGAGPLTPFRMIGTHTDSPSFKLKPNPGIASSGYRQLAVEIYGSPLLNSWLDRELGLAGRLVTDGEVRLVSSKSIARIPQLAVHLDRGVNDDGLKLDKQRHTQPVWSLGDSGPDLLDHLAQLAGLQVATT
jgi:aspartyl aminopeptidase